VEAGHGEVPIATAPAAAFVHAAGATILLEHVTEYELVDGRELALTVLRSTGLISRNDNPFREDPAGPEVPVPGAQLVGPWSFGFAVMPHAGSWEDAGVLEAVESYRLPFVTTPGRGTAESGGTRVAESSAGDAIDRAGLRIDGRGVVLSALRRVGDELEVRLVAQTTRATTASISGRAIVAAHDVDLLGRAGVDLAVDADDTLRVELAPWEIRTVRLRTGNATPL
jgi:mannosylglycerate hydrolase